MEVVKLSEPNERTGKLSTLKSLFEQRDSIKVSRTAAGKYSFEVKRHYDFDKTRPDDIIGQIENIYEELEKRFSG